MVKLNNSSASTVIRLLCQENDALREGIQCLEKTVENLRAESKAAYEVIAQLDADVRAEKARAKKRG